MLFIVNPISGKGRKNNLIDRIREASYKVVHTEYAGHAEILAREAEEETIVAVGGDGTVNEVARGIIGTGKTLGIIPCGSGDGLALHLGISRNINKALEILKTGRRHPLDAATINGRVFFSVCGVGFDAVVSERFAKSGKRGMLSYIEQGLRTWNEFRPDDYRITIDGKTLESKAALITVGNSNQWGNGAKITPLADSSDGILDITIADPFKLIDMPALGVLLLTGHIDIRHDIHCLRGKEIIIERNVEGPAHADGDWFSAGKRIEISVIPHALNVMVP